MLIGLGISLAGCVATREPILLIAPSYSYVQDDLARGVDSSTLARHAGVSTIAKLPPIPSVPLFDPLVFRNADQPSE